VTYGTINHILVLGEPIYGAIIHPPDRFRRLAGREFAGSREIAT
jgi:hypothetical protein